MIRTGMWTNAVDKRSKSRTPKSLYCSINRNQLSTATNIRRAAHSTSLSFMTFNSNELSSLAGELEFHSMPCYEHENTVEDASLSASDSFSCQLSNREIHVPNSDLFPLAQQLIYAESRLQFINCNRDSITVDEL